MSSKWRVAVVNDTSVKSLGGHGLHGAFIGLPGVEIVALVESNLEHLDQKLAHTEAQRHYLTIDEMLAKESPDIVVLCSRHPNEHLPQIALVAAAGCHIYCEKPLAVTVPECDRIIEQLEQHGVLLCMGHPARYTPEFRELKRLVEDGAIGTPLTCYGRGKSDHRGGGEDLMTLGTHILDYQTYLFGTPEYLWADVTFENQPLQPGARIETVEPLQPCAGDAVFAYFRFANGVRGTFESRRDFPRPEPGLIHMGVTVRGTEGAVSMRFNDPGWRDVGLRLSRGRFSPEDETHYEPVPVTDDREIPGFTPIDYARGGTQGMPRAKLFLDSNPHAAWDLICAIESGRQPVSNAYTARVTAEMIQAMYASALSGGVVKLPLVEREHPLGER